VPTDDSQPPATGPGTRLKGRPGIPAADLDFCLRVLTQAGELPVEHP